jgi:hypothetical protein
VAAVPAHKTGYLAVGWVCVHVGVVVNDGGNGKPENARFESVACGVAWGNLCHSRALTFLGFWCWFDCFNPALELGRHLLIGCDDRGGGSALPRKR